MGAKPRADSYDWSVMRWYLLLILALFLLLLGRLFYLQVIAGNRLKLASLDNIIRSVRTAPPRGDIFDRSGRQLAKSANVHSLLYMVPDDIDSYFISETEIELFSTLGPIQLEALSSITRNQLDLIRELYTQDYSAFRDEAIRQRKLPRKLSAEQEKLVSSLLQLHVGELRQTVLQHLLATQEFTPQQLRAFSELTSQQLVHLTKLPRSPHDLHPDIISMVVKTRAQPYLHRQTGKALREIVRLSAYLQIPYTELMQRIATERKRVLGFQPVTIVDALTQKQVVYLAENEQEFTGILIEQYGFKRVYPLGELAAHLIGYIGLVTENDPQSIKDLGYGPREQVGKEGVERAFEQILHGSGGHRDLEGNRERICLDVVREVPPKKGNSIYLTIDKEIQAKAQSALGWRPGAAIICNLQPEHEGEILALASSPGFDPSRFNEKSYFASLLSNKHLPLLNRAYRHAFPPGSTFKLVTSTAALQTGKYTPGSSWTCFGKRKIGNREFKCHEEAGHGGVTLIEAIAKSCDIAFYGMGLGLDNEPETLKRFAEYFGYGAPTGIELPGEVSGNLPDERWKREHYGKLGYGEVDQQWYQGDTANYAIGQGFLTATPLQVLWSSNLVALNGMWYPPRLLYAREVDTKIIPEKSARATRRSLDPAALDSVKEGMRLAVTGGTCRKLNLSGMTVCAKTGTAESKPGYADHAWVVGFYPMQQPRYGFIVFFENGGSAGETAVPAARVILSFMRDYKPPAVHGDS